MVHLLSKRKVSFLLCFLFGVLISLFSHWAKAEILFEGYSKVTNGGVHCGYVISKYEFDPKKKQFISVSFMKTNAHCSNLTESWKAYSTADLKPLSYEYTSLVGSQTKTIDARFEKNKLVATVKDGSDTKRIVKDLPKGAFLSSFLVYVMLKSKSGLKADTKYDYKAVAEEDADIYDGVAYVKNLDDVNGVKAFKVLNEYKQAKFISMVTEKGEVVSTKSPAQGIATELVASPSLATNNIAIPTALLTSLFGEVPTGIRNEVFKRSRAAPPTTASLPDESSKPSVTIPEGASKQHGVQKGIGIQLKQGQSPVTSTTKPTN